MLAGVSAATVLLLIWSGRRARLGAVQYGAVAMVLVGMPVLYGFAILVGLPFGAMTWNRQDHSHMFDGFAYIGAGPAAAFALLILHLWGDVARRSSPSARRSRAGGAAGKPAVVNRAVAAGSGGGDLVAW